MGDNDAAMFEYLIQMGAMNPEMEQLKRKQAQVEALRGAQMGMGTTVGSGGYEHYVPKGVAGAAAALGKNAIGALQQKGVDEATGKMNSSQAKALEEMRKRMLMGRGAGGDAGPELLNVY
jgi:hypothetical protein